MKQATRVEDPNFNGVSYWNPRTGVRVIGTAFKDISPKIQANLLARWALVDKEWNATRRKKKR